MKIQNLSFAFTAALALAAAFHFSTDASAAGNETKLDTSDVEFIQNEAASGVALLNLAKLGEKNAQRADVKSFAGMLAADHTQANAALASLAASKGLAISPEPVAKYGDAQTKLEGTGTADFDQEFLTMVVSGHEKCIKKFKKASTNSKDAGVKEWATNMLPTLQSHLVQAEKLKSSASAKENTSTPVTTEPDNTAKNVRDRNAKTLTPLDQGNGKADIDRTAQIRREIIDMKGLSINAQNVKIITNGGHVTLRGPVDSEDEKRIIGEIASAVATSEHTDNQLEVSVITPN